MEPSPLFVYDTAGLSAHYAALRLALRPRAGVNAPARRSKDSERDATQRWEEEGGSSLRDDARRPAHAS